MAILAIEKQMVSEVKAIIVSHSRFPGRKFANKTFTNGETDPTRTHKWWMISFKNEYSDLKCFEEIDKLLESKYPDYYMDRMHWDRSITIKHVSKKSV